MSNEGQWQQSQPGMTLRDYFAGQALQGMLSDPSEGSLPVIEADWINYLSRRSYEYADAMLAARERKAKSDAR